MTLDWGQMPKWKQKKKEENFLIYSCSSSLIVVFFLYTILPLIIHHDVTYHALSFRRYLVNLLLMGGYIRERERGETISLGKALVNTLNKGAFQFPNAFVSVVTRQL